MDICHVSSLIEMAEKSVQGQTFALMEVTTLTNMTYLSDECV